MKPVGYLIALKPGWGIYSGEAGSHYTYVMAKNGLFITAQNKLITAQIKIADASIRGLVDLDNIAILYPRIPHHIFLRALAICRDDPERERYLAIAWSDEDKKYKLRIPDQERSSASVNYRVEENTIMDIHSHGSMNAFFSEQDNNDEQGFKFYGVIGRLFGASKLPHIGIECKLRIGIYGYFCDVHWGDIFEDSPLLAIAEQSS